MGVQLHSLDIGRLSWDKRIEDYLEESWRHRQDALRRLENAEGDERRRDRAQDARQSAERVRNQAAIEAAERLN